VSEPATRAIAVLDPNAAAAAQPGLGPICVIAVVVSNQGWLKATLVLGVLGFAAAAVCSLADAVLFEQGYGASGVMLAMGFVFGAGAIIGARLLPYLNHSLSVADDGVTIVDGETETFFPWDTARFRVSVVSQIIDVFDASGHRVYSVDFYARNALTLLRCIRERGTDA
jgi:hypothetical protein